MKKLLCLLASISILLYSSATTYAKTQTIDINEYVCDAVLNGNKQIDVGYYHIKITDAIQVTTTIMQTNFDLYRVKEIDCKFDGNYVKYFVIKYDKNAIENTPKINSILDAVVSKANTKETDYEKVKFVYDYIIDNYDYDFNLKNHSVYELLTEGKGVCSAYSMLFDKIKKNICEIFYEFI